MSEYTVHGTDQEARESLQDLEDMLEDYRTTQETLDEQRALLTDQVQGALVEYDSKVSDYEERLKDLDSRQALHTETTQDAIESRDAIRDHLDARGVPRPGAGAKVSDAPTSTPDNADAKPAQKDETRQTATKADVKKLKDQVSKPKPELKLDPPGGVSQATTIDRDLKLMAEAQKKEGQLNDASKKVGSDWDKSKGPKP